PTARQGDRSPLRRDPPPVPADRSRDRGQAARGSCNTLVAVVAKVCGCSGRTEARIQPYAVAGLLTPIIRWVKIAVECATQGGELAALAGQFLGDHLVLQHHKSG